MLTSTLISLLLLTQSPSKPIPAPADPTSGISGDLMISTRRVVLAGAKRSDNVSLMNNSAMRHTYRIAVDYRDMDEQGAMTQRADAKEGERPWQDLVRYAPRQVTLEPGQSQVVRLSVQKPSDLSEGEYRYYLNFQLLPAPEDPASLLGPKDAVRIQVQTVYGIGIPVIYRHGALRGIAGLADLSFEGASAGHPARLKFRLTRGGNASIYGHLSATFTPRGGAAVNEVGHVKGLAVYTGMAHRWVSLDLAAPKGSPLQGGRLHLTYTPDAARAPEAQVDLDLP